MREAVFMVATTAAFGFVPSVGSGADSFWPLDRTGLSVMLDRQISAATPYREETRWQTYQTYQDAARTLWFSGVYSVALSVSVSAVFPDYPDLTLLDNDGNHRADYFAYYGEGDDTQEFGAIFARSGADTGLFWLVFNGGLVPDLSAPEAGPIWYTYHAADRDGDGQIDVLIANDIDFNGDGHADGMETVWAFDDDGDGGFERTEYNIHGVAVPATLRETPVSQLAVPSVSGPDSAKENSFLGLMQSVFDDLSAALAGSSP